MTELKDLDNFTVDFVDPKCMLCHIQAGGGYMLGIKKPGEPYKEIPRPTEHSENCPKLPKPDVPLAHGYTARFEVDRDNFALHAPNGTIAREAPDDVYQLFIELRKEWARKKST